MFEKIRPGAILRIGKSAEDIGNVQKFLEGNALRRLRKIDSNKECVFPVPGKIPDILLGEMLRIWFFKKRIGNLEQFDRKLLGRMTDLLKTPKCGRMMKLGNKKIIRSTRGIEVVPDEKNGKIAESVVRIIPGEIHYFGSLEMF